MKISAERKNLAFWKRYYYSYLWEFVSFLVPPDASVFNFQETDYKRDRKLEIPKGSFDYVVLSDVLGFVNDVEDSVRRLHAMLEADGRIIVTQYSTLWEPLLRFASMVGLRRSVALHNWLSILDLRNFMYLAGFEIVKSGTKMLVPVYVPFISDFVNKIIANIWPFSKLGLFHYAVARKIQNKNLVSNPSLSLVVPARNECGTIEKIVCELPVLGSFTEIIFVEGNSTDATPQEIERVVKKYSGVKKIKYVKQDGKGKGDAVRKGFDIAEGDILAIYDADMTVPADEIEKFYFAISENKADFINGSRLVYPMQKESMRLLNYFGNKFFSLAFTWILGQQIKDTLCGTKVLWRKDYESIKKNRAFFGDFDPFGDFDLLFGAAKLNRKIIDLPIHYRERIYGTTNIQRWKHGLLLLKMTFFAARKIKFI